MYAELKDRIADWRHRADLAYPLQMWDCVLRAAGDAGSPSETFGALPYVPPAVIAAVPDAAARGLEVLDAGCLGGYGLFDLQSRYAGPPLRLTGLDVNPAYIALGRALSPCWAGDADVRFVCAPAEKTGLPDTAFSLIIARLLLPYTDVRAVLAEFHRVARPGAVLLVQSHAVGYYWRQLKTHVNTPRLCLYYLRPVLAGGLFRLTGRQFRSPRWREVALSRHHMLALCEQAGFKCFWEDDRLAKGRPMMAFHKRQPAEESERRDRTHE